MHFKQIKVYYPGEETEIPTAPPSPIAMPLDSRKLRRHDTFFYEETMQEKEKKIRNQKKHTDDQEKQLDLKECYLEVSLQNTPSEEIPNDMSREAFVMQGLNRRRLEGFLALAFGESSSGSSSSSYYQK
ncbi:hypothetical protein C8R42DRAFT_638079 [Lentinula raphanica]|nr:hypothetical protein C8R42DRAFT_729249 [Lentinula raphanica]KAJ3714671.1 hypothetical protein C8R42DRAFT_726158 [Lentinula raphanica]KAJ3728256.1 hypothetical protein C8R42DRAFT_638079 [Lentinula raphanica]KAJ3816330.1 hypothetical protein F5880DRAFT_1619459 [Lentinula raphanica]